MGEIIIPQGYKSALNLHDTQVAIKTVKDYFQHELTHRLHLLRVTAPLFVQPETGLNDNLNGVEHPVSFELKDQGTKKTAEIVQSLAKWKRYALHKYGFSEGEGIYTDMNAIRQNEVTDNIHSVYVDQWDWEKIMSPEERNLDFLKSTVKDIYEALKNTEKHMADQYDYIETILPAPANCDAHLAENPFQTVSSNMLWQSMERFHRFLIAAGSYIMERQLLYP